MKKRSSYEGLQENIRRLKTPKLEVWQNKYLDRDYTIEIEFPEFTCMCPKTGLPDFASINIRYIPDKVCLELKSLKLYMIFYRSVGVFHEHVINRILNDLTAVTRPRMMQVTGEFNVRGGIRTTVTAEYKKQ
ncbi:MAG: NADPH-dependent 7-cyano-7-deazaguanine reductase QueF [Candidatus Omnitrophica bacterium CG07_land_8_20_14_0_80_42_15]|uniref:NADPH-dependent 7-cyano-7-deazaguanine reductase n=1 Tax=Candidatus Aquitaenariimonas noxiae TaxID=1974741 RepID=A0A2J0KQC5_9BACT|nr:MAG: NADPH-dependent 7-cyano-7-deazaguanine reductase QueF [Candidatus Omnitrophica bacterium CG07_land_8_20_14_0_80_42_15]